ncbi:MAG: WYL domain-containing protein, partial [Bacteroidales bacterium]|nr:WYL domain-containing protein [Bacteroidales bacterium]
PDELLKVKAAIEVLTRFVGLPQFEWVYEILPILNHKLKIVPSRPVIELHSNKDFTGLNYIEVFYQAIINRAVLQVTYQSFHDPKPDTFIFHPYYLKEYNNRWFVYGLNEEVNKHTWNLALDRIIEVKHTNIEYKPFEFDWEDYFYDIIGVTRYEDEKPEKIELIVYPESAKYIYHKPIHPSQKAEFEGEQLRVRLKLIPNREFMNVVLSYGKNIEIISPPHLRQAFKQELEEAYKRYCKNDPA